MHEYHILKYGGITAHLGSDKLYFCSGKTSIYTLQFKETDIVTLKLMVLTVPNPSPGFSLLGSVKKCKYVH